MDMVTSEAVTESLRQYMDPEVPINIVDMGLIYGVDVDEDDAVSIRMTMTTQRDARCTKPWYPMSPDTQRRFRA